MFLHRFVGSLANTLSQVSACCCLLIIDRFGRRKMMLYGSVTMGSCYLVASMCLKAVQNDPSKERMVSNPPYRQEYTV